jgi:hypothetical protein
LSARARKKYRRRGRDGARRACEHQARNRPCRRDEAPRGDEISRGLPGCALKKFEQECAGFNLGSRRSVIRVPHELSQSADSRALIEE